MLDKLKHLSIEERKQYVRNHPQEVVELAETNEMVNLSRMFGVSGYVIYDVLKSVYDGLDVPKD